MYFSYFAATAILAGAVSAQLPTTNTATGTSDIAAAQATAKTNTETSHARGKVFDRFVVIWLENTDYTDAFNDPNLSWLGKQGIVLGNNYAATHPSEPNYVACVAGEYFGMNNDNFNAIPKNVSTIVDVLEDKGISWAEYQEDMPYTGFEGFQYLNSKGANDYVRKHNPLVVYNSVAENPNRLASIKNFTQFYKDLDSDKLPQWMFITPNMTDDGHDTNVTFAGAWARRFLEPLLSNKKFIKNTLILLTFDENETYTTPNKAWGALLGDVVPKKLQGTMDSNYYNHYSEIATVEANWDLHTLGRWDVGANVYSFVGERTGDHIRNNPTPYYYNASYPGILNSLKYAPQPVPNTKLVHNGRTVLPSIRETWKNKQKETYYTDSVVTPDGAHPPVYPS